MRNALIRHTMACLWAKDAPKLEDLLPRDDEDPQSQESEDERMTRKLDLVMAQFGGVMPADKPEQPQEADEFTRKMWRLMGVEE